MLQDNFSFMAKKAAFPALFKGQAFLQANWPP